MYEEMWNVIECIQQYYMPIFLCLSLLGNGLSVYMLFCTRLRYNSSSIYLGALAMSDIGVLVTIFMMWFKLNEIIHDEYSLDILLLGSQMLFIFLSVWIVVAFTVQRYIAIKWPLLRRSLCNVNRARNVVIGLTGLAVLYSIPWFIYKTIKKKKSNANEDTTNLKPWFKILITIDFIIIFIIPAIMIVIFNVLMVYNIRKQNHMRRNLMLNSNENTGSSSNETSHIKITKMLLIISSIFVCFNTPLQVCHILIYYEISSKCFWSIDVIYILYITNYGINFVLYFATGKNFRKKLIRIFTKCSNIRRNRHG